MTDVNSTPEINRPPLALRTREAADALGISERTLQSLVANSEVPHVRLGRAVLFPVRELQDWLTDQTHCAEENQQ